jgi:hypothetical protein
MKHVRPGRLADDWYPDIQPTSMAGVTGYVLSVHLPCSEAWPVEALAITLPSYTGRRGHNRLGSTLLVQLDRSSIMQ